MKSNGFTLIELLGVIAILGILFGLSVGGIQRYIAGSRQKAYDTMASSTVDAMEEYILKKPGTTSIDLQTLKDEDLLSSITDPASSDKECSGVVSIESQKNPSKKILDDNKYTVSLCCSNYNYTYTFPGGTKEKDDSCKVTDSTGGVHGN